MTFILFSFFAELIATKHLTVLLQDEIFADYFNTFLNLPVSFSNSLGSLGISLSRQIRHRKGDWIWCVQLLLIQSTPGSDPPSLFPVTPLPTFPCPIPPLPSVDLPLHVPRSLTSRVFAPATAMPLQSALL